LGTATFPGIVVKVRLSDMTRVGALTLNPGESFLESAVIDVAGGFAYFGTLASPGIVVKVRLSDFTRVGALTLNPGEDKLRSAVIDVAGGFAYFGTATSPGIVVKVGVGAPIGIPLSSVKSSIIEAAGGSVYLIYPDYDPGHSPKGNGAKNAALSDFTAMGVVYGMTVNQQIAILDTTPETVEIAYDDGNPEHGTYWGGAGGMLAVRFNPTLSGQLKTVRFYIYSKLETIRIHLMDQSKSDIVTPFLATPSATGWFDVDVFGRGVLIASGVDFYVAAEWTVANRPWLGSDTSNPDGRSYTVTGSLAWTQVTDVDYMIRAVIQTPYVMQSTGKPLLAGKGIVLVGGQMVHACVRYYENQRIAPVYPSAEGTTYYWYTRAGVKLTSTGMDSTLFGNGISYHQDMFVVEYFMDGSGNAVFVIYGYGWKGSFAGGEYFKSIIYPSIDSYTHSYYIFNWVDANGDGFPDLNEISQVTYGN